MLKKLTLSGVKSFEDEATLICAPITIVTGSNSSGKSSLFQVLRLLAQLIEDKKVDKTFVRMNGKRVQQGSFRDWSTNHEERPIWIHLEYLPIESFPGPKGISSHLKVSLEKGGTAPSSARLVWVAWEGWIATQDAADGSAEHFIAHVITDVPKGEEIVEKLLDVLDGGSGQDSGSSEVANEAAIALGLIEPAVASSGKPRLPYQAYFALLDSNKEEIVSKEGVTASVSGLMPDEISDVALDTYIGRPRRSTLGVTLANALKTDRVELISSGLSWSPSKCVDGLAASIFHLGPLRAEPRMVYSGPRPQAITDIGSRGERSVLVLAEYGDEFIVSPVRGEQDEQSGKLTLRDELVYWAERIGVVSSIDVGQQSKFGAELTVSAVFSSEKREANVATDLTNVGIGVSQVLPVLVLCLAAEPGETVLLEQPELHLHPAVQSRLADFFAACALSGRQILIESHSQHLINRFRLLVARGVLNAEDHVSVNFIERDKFGSKMIHIEIDSSGGLDRWPKGFFDETENALEELLNVRLG